MLRNSKPIIDILSTFLQVRMRKYYAFYPLDTSTLALLYVL